MKKTTIALLTAAAMGTSGAVMAANHGPEISGRVNLDIQNIEGDSTNFTRGNGDRVQVSGSGELAAGMSGRYFVRLEDRGAGEVDNNFTKAFYAVSGDFGEVLFGRDDDIVYKFVGVRTDVANANIVNIADAATNSDTTTDQDDVSLQYQFSVDALTFGAYVDTLDEDEDGFNNYQVGVQGDFGLASAGLVYSDSDVTGAESELAFGVTLNLDVATLSATVRDDSNGNNPVAVIGSLPLQNGLTAYAGYGDDDNGSDNALFGVSADLGGGFVTYAEYVTDGATATDGSTNNSGFVIGGQFSF